MQFLNPTSPVDTLNDFGNKSWELVQIQNGLGVFKRPLIMEARDL